MSGWLETYRGTVYRWEVDHNDHLTVAYYFARIADAGLGVLEASGLGADYAARGRRACVTADCYVRYSRELRVGDILHIESGVIDVEATGDARAAFGMTPAYMRAERRGFSTFEFQLALGAPLTPGDPVRVRSALLHVGRSSMRLLHVMTNERSGERVATLEQLGVHLDMDARRPTALPEALREKARAILAPTGD